LRGFAYSRDKTDGSCVAGIFTTLAPDLIKGETSLIDIGCDFPGEVICSGKQWLGAYFDALLAKGAFIDSEVDFRKPAIAFDNNFCFTGLNALVATGADIGKFDICFAPRGPDCVRLSSVKQSSATLVYLTHLPVSLKRGLVSLCLKCSRLKPLLQGKHHMEAIPTITFLSGN